MSNEALFLAIDIASQSINNSWRNSKQKILGSDIQTAFMVVISFVLSS